MSGTTCHDTVVAPAVTCYRHSLQLALATPPDDTLSDTNKLVQAFTLFEMHRRLTQQDQPIMHSTTFVSKSLNYPL